MINYAAAERRVLTGAVDFTMMYTAHDAFSRHLGRLVDAVADGHAASRGTSARWTLFERQLHVHHTAEDVALWPRLREAVSTSDDAGLLDAMEAEHAQLNPLLNQVADRFASRDDAALLSALRELAAGLGAHMRHEENEALPLVERYLGPAGWAQFGRHIRASQGLRAAAVYFPWLLDGAEAATAKQLLGIMPPPVRGIYRVVWAPRYRRSMR
jgi:iron-sulfur cluster repair protein YtfE (RIC family)